MKKLLTAITITASLAALAAAATHQYLHASTDPHQSALQSKLHVVEKTLSERPAGPPRLHHFHPIPGGHQESHLRPDEIPGRQNRPKLRPCRAHQQVSAGHQVGRTIILNYAVEYSVGYDLSPESFAVAADATGITVTLKKPELVSSPAIGAISHEIPGKGLLIDEKEQVIALQQRLITAAAKQGDAIKMEEAVIALFERKLGEFLRDFLAKQPNVRAVPMIKFA
jgi:hypothetical protein